ncbi:glycosyltransferase family 2 protein [Candidatus Pelagibacter sp.]|jgi:glycosyltransferase involved in cell wall biosynthesis|nr:glycosyltransferase family 2 protein [Candidatus Pelagibacter sp.]MDC1248457.1 glycosyltransferase family 2 protein [Pelagibacteraceae bacterium]
MNELTLLIPAKNEAESLPIVLDELKKYNYKIDIILHITDLDTIQAIREYDVNIIYQENLGYGDALIQGIKQCKTKYFCIFNADGSFNPAEIDNMFKSMQTRELDFIFASRYEPNSGSEDDTTLTLIGNYIFSYIGKIFFKLNITDILYTFLIGNTSKAKKLNLSQKDFTLCVELPIKVKKNQMKFGCINSFERKRIAGKKKVNAFKDGFLILCHMIKLFFNKSL